MNENRTVADLYRYDRIADVLPSPGVVDACAAARYAEEGYLAVANVLTSAEVSEAQIALDDLLNERVPNARELLQPEPDQKAIWDTLTIAERADRVRKVWRFADHEPRLKAIGDAHPTIQTLLERLLGEPANMIQDMAMLKPPFVGTEKPWHQDAAYFGYAPVERIIGVWIALDPATAENGCMHVLPGTHRAGPVPHTHDRDCQIPDARVEVARDVIVPLAPGGALFFSALLHHGTPPNASPLRRRALQYHYAAASCRTINRVEHAALFFEEGRYQGCRGQMGRPLAELEP